MNGAWSGAEVRERRRTPPRCAWSTSTPWRWLNVPRRVSWPASRTGVPSSSSDPKASVSASAQSTSSCVERDPVRLEDALELRVHREAVGAVVSPSTIRSSTDRATLVATDAGAGDRIRAGAG